MESLTDQPIDPAELLAFVHDHSAGAVVLFLGTTRNETGGRPTKSLDYESIPDMAIAQLHELLGQARARWKILRCGVVHRLGHLELGEASVAVAVSAPHRKEAFEAAEWIMERIKEVVPIWKRENWADGTSQWVHPGA